MITLKFFEKMLGVLAYNDQDAVKKGKIKKEVKKEVDNYDLPDPDEMTDEEIEEFMEGMR